MLLKCSSRLRLCSRYVRTGVEPRIRTKVDELTKTSLAKMLQRDTEFEDERVGVVSEQLEGSGKRKADGCLVDLLFIGRCKMPTLAKGGTWYTLVVLRCKYVS